MKYPIVLIHGLYGYGQEDEKKNSDLLPYWGNKGNNKDENDSGAKDDDFDLTAALEMELDEKYASVILRRAVENGIAPEDIFVERDGKQIPYADLVKEVELPDGTE